MSSVMKPVGPEEPQVYWKRRALVVGIVLLALLILFLVFRPKGGDEEQLSAPVSPSPSPTPTGSVSPSPTGSPTTTTSPTTASRMCPDTDIEVTVTPDAQTYPADVEPVLSMAIANTGSFACQRDVGAGANEVVVSSGGVQVWSSDDCSPSTESDIQSLEPGKSATLTITWPRTKSAAGCPSDQPPVPAGSYDAVGRNGKVESEPAAMTLQ